MRHIRILKYPAVSIFVCILSAALLFPPKSFAARKSTAVARSYVPVPGRVGDPTSSNLYHQNPEARAITKERITQYRIKLQAYQQAKAAHQKSVIASRAAAKKRREEDYQRRRAEWEKKQKALKEREEKRKAELAKKNADKGGEEVVTEAKASSSKQSAVKAPGRPSNKEGNIWTRVKSVFAVKKDKKSEK